MAILSPLLLSDAQAIGRNYGLNIENVDALAAGSVNSNFRLRARDGKQFFLRIYEEQPVSGARAELSLLRNLSALGIATALPIARTVGGGDVDMHGGKPVGLYQWVDGEILCQHSVTPRAVEQLGRALAKVHQCSRELPEVPKGRFGVEQIRQRLDRIDKATEEYREDTSRIRDRLSAHEAMAGLGSRGLIHGDLFRDNVLWRPGVYRSDGPCEIAALIDFESASEGAFAYDLMVCVHSWCFGEVYELPLVSALLSGYQSVRNLLPEDLEAMPHHGALAALRFAATRITDFAMRTAAGQKPVRDYRRFLRRLDALEAGALDSVLKEAGK